MTIYVVTNRATTGNTISSTGKERALPTFRVGEFNPAGRTVDLYPDLLSGGYANPKNRQRGTAKLFFDLRDSLRQADAANRREDVLVFVHGYNYSYDDSLQHIEMLRQRYLAPRSDAHHLIYFSWPSLGGNISTDSYRDDQRDAHETGIALSRLFLKLSDFVRLQSHEKQPRCRQRMHLMVHSMGNQVLEFMLRALPEQLMFQLFGEALLLNSDVDWTVFESGQPFGRLPKLAARTHIYIHREDNALMKSADLLNSVQRLGFRGPSNIRELPPETYVVDTTKARELAPDLGLSDRLREQLVDHWGYLYRDGVIGDITKVIAGGDEDDIDRRSASTKYPNWFELA